MTDVHVYLHVDLTVRNAHPASGLRLTIGEKPMPHELTVDTTNETATVTFVDSHGNDTTQPDGFGSILFTSSDESVLGIVSDPGNPLQGNLTPVAVGDGVTVSAAPLDQDGNPLLEADGSTPFPTATSDAIDVNPGAAAGERITVGPA